MSFALAHGNWRLKLTALFTLALGSALLFQVAYVLPRIRSRDMLSARLHQREIGHSVARLVEANLVRLARTLQAVADELAASHSRDDWAALIQAAVHDWDAARSLAVLNERGQLVAATAADLSAYSDLDYADSHSFRIPFEQGRAYVGAPRVRVGTGHMITTISVPLAGPRGQRIGVVSAEVVIDSVLDDMESYPLPEDISAMLLDQRGRVIALARGSEAAEAPVNDQPLVGNRPWRPSSNDVPPEGGRQYDYDSGSMAGHYVGLQIAPWAIAVERPQAAVRSRTLQFVRQLLLVNLGVFAAALAVTLLFTREITAQRQRYESELRRSEARYRGIFENLQDAYFEVGPDETLTLLSPSIRTIAGRTHDELRGTPVEALFETPSAWRGLLEALDASRQVTDWETRLAARDKAPGPIVSINARIRRDDAGAIADVRGTIRDIADRKRAEEQLRYSETTARALLNASFDYALLVDRTMTVLAANQAVADETGLAPADLVGRTVPDLQCPGLRGCRTSRVLEVFCNGRPARFEENVGGTCFEYSVYPVFGDSAQVQRVAVCVRDVSDQKRLESRLRDVAKMEAVGALAGSIAHDFNNLLTGVLGCAEAIKRKLDRTSRLHHYAERILTAIRRATHLTDRLLTFARRQDMPAHRIDLNELLHDIVELARHGISRNMTIHEDLSAANPVCLGDDAQLQNAFINLIINARDAMDDAGELTVATRRVELESATAVPGFDVVPGPFVLVSFADRGVGMDEETLQRAFEPFFTTKNRGEGTGLGLPSVYATVKNHGGGLVVNSQPGRGTTFELYFPVAEGASVEVVSTDEAAARSS